MTRCGPIIEPIISATPGGGATSYSTDAGYDLPYSIKLAIKLLLHGIIVLLVLLINFPMPPLHFEDFLVTLSANSDYL